MNSLMRGETWLHAHIMGYKRSLNGLSMMWIICSDSNSPQTSTHVNIHGRFWNDVFYHHQQNAKWGNIFGKNVVPSPQQSVRDFYNLFRVTLRMCWHLLLAQHLLRLSELVFPLFCPSATGNSPHTRRYVYLGCPSMPYPWTWYLNSFFFDNLAQKITPTQGQT